MNRHGTAARKRAAAAGYPRRAYSRPTALTASEASSTAATTPPEWDEIAERAGVSKPFCTNTSQQAGPVPSGAAAAWRHSGVRQALRTTTDNRQRLRSAVERSSTSSGTDSQGYRLIENDNVTEPQVGAQVSRHREACTDAVFDRSARTFRPGPGTVRG